LLESPGGVGGVWESLPRGVEPSAQILHQACRLGWGSSGGSLYRVPVKGSCAEQQNETKKELRRREPKDNNPTWPIFGVETASCLRETHQERWGASPPTFPDGFPGGRTVSTPQIDQFELLSFGSLRGSSLVWVPDYIHHHRPGGFWSPPGVPDKIVGDSMAGAGLVDKISGPGRARDLTHYHRSGRFMAGPCLEPPGRLQNPLGRWWWIFVRPIRRGPPHVRGYKLGYRSGYKSRSRAISGIISGLSRYKFGCEAPKLKPTYVGRP
jgi:hypothetical protein